MLPWQLPQLTIGMFNDFSYLLIYRNANLIKGIDDFHIFKYYFLQFAI